MLLCGYAREFWLKTKKWKIVWQFDYFCYLDVRVIKIIFLIFAILSFSGLATATGKMTFNFDRPTVADLAFRQMVDGGQTRIYASGDLDAEAADRFREFVQARNIKWAAVYFDSPGGSLIGGIRLGQAIRDLKFDSYIGAISNNGQASSEEAMCVSACAYAFAGGLHRYFYGDKQHLGIHQFYSKGDNKGDVGDAQAISGLLIAYLQKMGVDASAFALASTARGDQMIWLSREKAESLGFSNNGVEPTTAEIKLTGRRAYLRFEQVRDKVTTRLLLNCIEGGVAIMAGIVTNPEVSVSKRDGATRNYLDLDGEEVLPMPHASGMSVVESTLWIERSLSAGYTRKLLDAEIVGAWTENGGPFRWGAFIDLKKVRPKLKEFVSNCTMKN